jgi:gamma-glutamyltranspeptidase
MDPLSALVAPRVHTQLLPDKVDVEEENLPVLGAHPMHSITSPATLFTALIDRNHRNVTHCSTGMGVAQFITVDRDTGLLHAVSDPRKDGRPAAYS